MTGPPSRTVRPHGHSPGPTGSTAGPADFMGAEGVSPPRDVRIGARKSAAGVPGWMDRQMGRVIRRGRPTKRADDNGSSAVNQPEFDCVCPQEPECPPPRSEFRQMGWSDIDVNPEQLDPSGLVACREGRPGWTKRHSLSAVGSGGFCAVGDPGHYSCRAVRYSSRGDRCGDWSRNLSG